MPAHGEEPLEVVRANVVNKAAELGLPVHTEDVRVIRDGTGAAGGSAVSGAGELAAVFGGSALPAGS